MCVLGPAFSVLAFYNSELAFPSCSVLSLIMSQRLNSLGPSQFISDISTALNMCVIIWGFVGAF